MSNITSSKLLLYPERIQGDFRPITADLFLTNYCNNRCPYCTYRRWKFDADARAIPFDDFTRNIKRLLSLGVVGFILTGGGEPTIHPEFERIATWLSENHINYGINTNFNRLLFFKPTYIKVSLDGYDRTSYKKSRGVDAYEQVIDNIKAFAEWKKRESPHTSLGIQSIPHSADDVMRFYEANKNLDVDYMVFRPIESTNGSYYSNGKNSEEIQSVTNAVKALSGVDKRCVLNFKWSLIGVQEKECTAQWAQIAVNEKSEVMYCCHKPYQIIGNLMDDDILEKKAKAGTTMSMCDIPCRMTTSNSIMASIQSNHKDKEFI